MITTFINNLYATKYLTTVYCDRPEPWQIGFQDGASPMFNGITELHDAIFFYLILISVGVAWVIGSIVVNFSRTKSGIVYKYANHGTLIELVWTITPALILIRIRFPSFKLLYLMDNPYIINDKILFIRGMPISSFKNNNTAIVLYSYHNIGSTLNMSFNKIVRNITYFPKHIISQLVGHLLGDGSIAISKTSTTPYFVFSQTMKRFRYVWYVFGSLNHYCNKLPRLVISKRNNTILASIYVITWCYPIIKELQQLFYSKIDNKYVKTINLDIINYLDRIALAYWAIDDGAATTKGSGFYLHTKSFTFQEVYKLRRILHYNFNLYCTVQNHTNIPVIYITSASIKNFTKLVKPYFHSSIIYKLIR